MSRRFFGPGKTMEAELHAGTVEHYEDPGLYDYEYRRRRADVNYYRRLAASVRGPILELGCGSGRLLLPLVRDGRRVVGLDYSQPMLRRCTERLARLKPQVRARAQLVRADFRAFSLGQRFALIVSPFNAMMHLYTRDDFFRFMDRVRAHLAPGGTFAFDVLNPDVNWLARDPHRRWAKTRFRHPRTGQLFHYTTNHTYDAAAQIAWIRIYYDPIERPSSTGRIPRSHVVHLAHRQFFPEELAALIEQAGFILDERDGGFGGERFASAAESQVCKCSIAQVSRR